MAAHSYCRDKQRMALTSALPMPMPKIMVTSTDTASGTTTATVTTKKKPTKEPKSPDNVTGLLARKSLTSMTDDEIIQENLKQILEMKSREERKANGRLVAVIVAFLVIFTAVYHTWIRKPAELTGMLVPAGIMLSYGAWVVVLAKRDKRKRAMFQRHIEEVALKNKSELEQKHTRAKNANEDKEGDGASGSVKYVNEVASSDEQRKKQRRHKKRQRDENTTNLLTVDVKVHRNGPKRPSFRQKLFGQTIAHVKLLEMQCDSSDQAETDGGASELTMKRERLQRTDTLPMPQIKRMSSAP